MKIQRITEFFVHRKVLFWSLVAAIIIAGILAFIQMPKLEDPAVAVKQAQVVLVYPGANAHQVELEAVQPVEESLRTLPDVKEIRTDCQNGMANITVEFKMTVLNKDLEQHFDLLRRKMNDVKSSLPQECYAPVVVDDMMDTYGLFYALESTGGYSFNEMEKYAKLIRRELLTVEGVKRINIVGMRQDVINVRISKDKLAANGIVPTQIMMSLQKAGSTVNAGKYENGDDRIDLRVSNEIRNERDVADLLIKTTDGKEVRIGDIATVKREYQEPQTRGFFVDGKPSLAICIALQDNVVVPDVGKAVDAKLATVTPRLPAGMKATKVFFQPDKVNEAINGFMVNLLESVLIVIIVLMFTMGFRSGLIIGTGLILTIAVSFPILLTLGSTLQRISLGAFIIAMGMLVDNSIVIMDGILVDKQRGFGPKTYLYRIGNNTAFPLLAATVIAISTFLAPYLSPDSAGEYCRDMFLVLCVSLLSSWVLAIIQVPVCAKSWLPVKMKPSGSNSMNSPIHRLVRRVVTCLIGHKAVTITVAIVLLVACCLGMKNVKNLFFPDFDYGQFILEYELPSQTSPDKVRDDLLKITAELKKDKRVDRVSASQSCAPAHYSLVMPMTYGGDNFGVLIVDCKDFKTVNEVIADVKPKLRQEYPDAYIRFRHYNFSIQTSHQIEARFKGPDPAVLRRLSAQAEDIMRHSKYADPYSVCNNWHPMAKTLEADYVRRKALLAGLQRSDVANALLAATDGMPIGVIHDKDKQVVIDMQIRNEDGSKIKDFSGIPVWSTLNVNLDPKAMQGLMTGATSQADLQSKMFRSAPLSAVADGMKLKWEDDFIHRVDGQRCIEAQCDPNTDIYEGTAAKCEADVKPLIEKIPLPEGYTLEWAGEGKTSNQATTLLLKYLPLTMFIILGLLLLLFNNWKEVILILLCLPFAICGITPALLAFRQPFTFMAIIGMMGLIGMMTKNAIVLVDEINRQYREEHKDSLTSVVEATVSRVRPVVMAAATTILGMAPLLGDPMYGSMAITIMSGLTIGTLITLILLPVLYSALFKVKRS